MCSRTILRLSHGKIYHVRAPSPCFHTTNNGGLGTGIMSRWLCDKFAEGSLTPQFWQLCNHPPFTISDLKTFPCGSVSCVSHCQLHCRSRSLSGVGVCVKLWAIQALLPCMHPVLTFLLTATGHECLHIRQLCVTYMSVNMLSVHTNGLSLHSFSQEQLSCDVSCDVMWSCHVCVMWCHVEQSRSAFQSSNPIGQFIIHIYIRIRAIALTTP